MTFPAISDELPEFYAMQASCHAHAEDPARADGLFAYLEGLGAIPGVGGELANVEDVVAYCLDHQAPQATGAPPSVTTSDESSTPGADEGADSTGAGTDTLGTPNDGSDPNPLPPPAPCGPYAMERFWARPSNNFGMWNEVSKGVGGVGAATSMASVTGGGIAYTMFPCEGAPGATCLRIDQLSAQLIELGSELVMHLGLVEDSMLMPVSAQGRFEVPAGALRLAVRYAWDDQEQLHLVRNDQPAIGYLDTIARSLHIEGLGVSSEQGDMLVTLSLAADLTNIQPSTEIIASRDIEHGGLRLAAQTFDADFDPIVHHWMILGVGSWRGDSIAPSLPVGRHAVILYADDVHRARGVAARWVEVTPSAR